MRVPIRRIVELVCPKPALFGGRALSDAIIVSRVAIRLLPNGEDSRPQSPEKAYFFRCLRFRNDNHGAITLCMPDNGEPDAGIPCGPFDDRVSRSKLSVGFRIQDDAEAPLGPSPSPQDS